jgi:iron complex outermembrane recepter protein
VDALPGLMVPSCVVLNVRLGWRPSENWEISIMGQNLLDNWHPEFSAGFGVSGQTPEVERSVYGKLVWRF